MSILGFIIAVCVICIMLYVASRLPVPMSYILYAVILIVCIIVLLSATGVLGSGAVLNRRI
jgi:hypothetical protein